MHPLRTSNPNQIIPQTFVESKRANFFVLGGTQSRSKAKINLDGIHTSSKSYSVQKHKLETECPGLDKKLSTHSVKRSLV